MHIRRLTDKEKILNFLETDRLYAAYAIGDLEPELYKLTEWMGVDDAGELRAIALLYKGFDFPVLFLMGEPTGLASVLRLGMRPQRAYLTCKNRHMPTVKAFYRAETPIPMWRMTVQPSDFRAVHSSDVIALSPRHTEELQQLYAKGSAGAFSPTQLATGVFFGVRDWNRIVAAAGTHLVSPTYGVAAVGNVYTDEASRGCGYGTAITSAVVAELFRRGIRHVILNVAQTNIAAIRIYERLGFSKYCPFLEMMAARRR